MRRDCAGMLTPSAFVRSLTGFLRKEGRTQDVEIVRRRAAWLLPRMPAPLPRLVAWQAFLLPEDAPSNLWSRLPGLDPRAAALARRSAAAVRVPETADRLLKGTPKGQADTLLAILCVLRVAHAVDTGDASLARAVPSEYWMEVADHFGFWQMRYLLEDALLRARDPVQFSTIERFVLRQERAQRLLFSDIAAIVRGALDREGIRGVRIAFRRKNIGGIAEKMRRKRRSLNHVTDIFGFRIITASVPDCYAARDVLHRLWRPYPDQESDYIAHPKPNGYQSLQTTVRCLRGIRVEFQIRTEAMDWIAKYGPAAHAAYKKTTRG